MFTSGGYFQNVLCPFYQYGLCHRPHCHYKHEKLDQSNGKRAEQNKDESNFKSNADDDDAIMQIVKNIPPSKLNELARKKQEGRHLKHKLDLIDQENSRKELNTDIRTPTASLIDTFYNVGQVHDIPSSSKSLNDITPSLNIDKRIRCECDDPDCTGYVDPLQVNDTDSMSKSPASPANTNCISKHMKELQEFENNEKTKNKLTDLDFFSAQACVDDEKNIVKKSVKKRKRRLSSETVDEVNKDECHTNLKKEILSSESVAKTGAASLKKRKAHSSVEVIRSQTKSMSKKAKQLSYISPGLSAPIKSSTSETATPTPEVFASMGYSTEQGTYVGKKRVAHSLCTTVKEKVVRPKLAMEVGGKVAHMLRQRYIDKIIDELIPKVKSEKKAIEKGFAEEAVAYQRCTRKQTYLNLCANIIQKTRSLPNYIPPTVGEGETNPLITADTTVKTFDSIKNSKITGYQKLNAQKISKRVIKAPSVGLINAASLSVRRTSSTKTSDHQKRLSVDDIQLNESNLYKYLEDYLLTTSQMWDNKYPMKDDDNDQVVMKDYIDSPYALKRLCCRCGKEYFMNAKGKYITKEECHFHWGKLRRGRGKGGNNMFFSCCQSDAGGSPCSISRLHVCNMACSLNDYVSTEHCNNDDAKEKIFSLDCEMCYTTQGLELTRLTVIDFNLEQIIDLFVKPKNPIVDYNTRFSGVTREHLQDVTTSIDDVHEILLNLFHKETILMGHSLESDLKALKMVHYRIIDTALIFPHRLGLPYKRALRNLMADHLQKIIQDGENGHDSCEDARACMELMKYKFTEDHKKHSRRNNTGILS